MISYYKGFQYFCDSMMKITQCCKRDHEEQMQSSISGSDSPHFREVLSSLQWCLQNVSLGPFKMFLPGFHYCLFGLSKLHLDRFQTTLSLVTFFLMSRAFVSDSVWGSLKQCMLHKPLKLAINALYSTNISIMGCHSSTTFWHWTTSNFILHFKAL